MKKRTVFLVAALCAVFCAYAETIDFERPTYNGDTSNGTADNETLHGLDGWTVYAGTTAGAQAYAWGALGGGGNMVFNGVQNGYADGYLQVGRDAYRMFDSSAIASQTRFSFYFSGADTANSTFALSAGSTGGDSTMLVKLLPTGTSDSIYTYDGQTLTNVMSYAFSSYDDYEAIFDINLGSDTFNLEITNLTTGASASVAGLATYNNLDVSDFASGARLTIGSDYSTTFFDNIFVGQGYGPQPQLVVDANSIGGTASDANPGTVDEPFLTIQAAVNAASAGTTVYLRGGVYHETVEITQGGTEGSPLVISAYSNELAIIDGQNQRTLGFYFPGTSTDFLSGVPPTSSPAGDHVRIENLRLVNFNPPSPSIGYAILAINRIGIVIDNVVVDNADFGVYVSNSEDVEIRNCEVHHCYPIRVTAPSRNIRINNNYVHHGTGTKCYAIVSHGPADASLARASVTSVVDVGGGVAECTVGIDAGTINMSGRDLQGETDSSGSFYPHCMLFYTNAPPISVLYPWPTGDIAGGQKELENGKTGFLLSNHSSWGNKPYSGTKVRVKADAAGIAALQSATYVHFINTWNPDVQRSHDFIATSNTVHDSNAQGMQFSNTENLFIKGNTLHHNGASGIQVEDGCRNVWIEGNTSYANSIVGNGECSIWTTLDRDVVVQDNTMHGSQSGFKINSCQRVLVRRNRMFDNRGQNAMSVSNSWFTASPVGSTRIKAVAHASAGLVLQGGGHSGIGAAPVVDECAFVHNTLVDNGVQQSTYLYGSLMCGNPAYAGIGGSNVFLNNIISSRYNENLFAMFHAGPYRIDGNLYDGPANARMVHYPGNPETYNKANAVFYPVGTLGGFSAYKAAMGQDADSVYGDPAFADPESHDFSLQASSKAIDIGVPLAYTASAGSGTNVPVTSTWAFTDGFRTSTGEQLAEGDTIRLGADIVQVVDVDHDAGTLTIDQSIGWSVDEPITYEFSGIAPDAGALEY